MTASSERTFKFCHGLEPSRNCYRATLNLHFSTGQYAYFYTPEDMNGGPGFSWQFLNSYDETRTSTGVIIVGNYENNEYILVGALTAYNSFTHFVVRNRASLPDFIEIRQDDIPADGSLPPEKIIVLEGNDWIQLLLDYRDKVVEENNISPGKDYKTLTGHYSWYYYLSTITEEQCIQDAARMAQARRAGIFKADFFQIDDGYQTFQGDWTDQNAAWPTPLKQTAAIITDMGFLPGIWLMPFMASTESKLFHAHPDWFVKTEDGSRVKLVNGWMFTKDNKWATLDITHPDVKEHLRNLFKTFWAWGFRYFKLGALSNATISGLRYDQSATPLSTLREGLNIIRQTLPDAYLLGSTSPFLPVMGYCDIIRVSAGNIPSWIGIKQAWQGAISKFWMFDSWFRCDSDFVVTRANHLVSLTPCEARFSVVTSIMTGVCMTCDRMEELEPSRVQLLTIAAQCHLQNIRPLSWAPNTWPMLFTGTLNGKPAIAICNWTDEKVEFSKEELGFSSRTSLGMIVGPFPGASIGKHLTMDPHDAALITLK